MSRRPEGEPLCDATSCQEGLRENLFVMPGYKELACIWYKCVMKGSGSENGQICLALYQICPNFRIIEKPSSEHQVNKVSINMSVKFESDFAPVWRAYTL